VLGTGHTTLLEKSYSWLRTGVSKEYAVSHSKNRLLALLAPQDLELFASQLRLVDMAHGQVLAEQHQLIERVYFPHGGIVSYVVEMSDGHMIETAMIGRDGVMGAIQVLDEKVSPNKIVVQVAGAASVIDADDMRQAVAASTSLRVMLAKHEQFFIAQVQQSVGCNAIHMVEARMCRWLLRMHDLVGPDLPLTQEFMAQMMGVRRTSVSLVAGELQEQGLITYRRGHVRIISANKLREAACECYEAVNVHYEKIFQTMPPASNGVAAK
jgi:CRP-like cAMP-binding protein